MNKVLSVSVAAYNVEKYIKEALDPFCQDGVIERVEVFVIDDGGSDATMNIAKEYSNRYPDSIKLVHKENGGWGSTLNVGFELATGKYFKQMDGDDYFRADTLLHFLDQLMDLDADIVSTPFEVFDDETGTITGIRGKYPSTDKDLAVADAHKIAKFEMHSCTVKSTLIKEARIRISEHCFYTDNEFIFKLLPYVKTVAILDTPVYRYRLGRDGQSVSLLGLKKHYHDFEQVFQEMVAFYHEESNSENIEILQSYLTHMMNMHYIIYSKLGMLHNIREFDKEMKESLPEVYIRARKKVKLWRKTGFILILLEYCMVEARGIAISKGLMKAKKAFS